MHRLPAAISLVVMLFCGPMNARADVVLNWNETAVATLTAQGVNPFAQARFLSIVQLAVFEAVNTISGEYEPYLGTVVAPVGASPDAAAATAAYRVLRTYFPGAAGPLDSAYAASLAAIPDGAAEDYGIATGEDAAAKMMAARANDGSAPPAFYTPISSDPGVWQTTPTCPATGGVFYQWPQVTPFGIPSTPGDPSWIEAFRPAPPPTLDSNTYTKDYDEVKTVGRKDSTARPADRSDVARFYGAATPSYLFSLATRQIVADQGNSPTENARSLALISMATSDSLVASMATKYHELLWRPETAIRAGDADGNDKTTPDAGFTPYVPTPCFPSYPSNHASASGASAEMMRRLFGAAGHDITFTHPAVAGVVLHYGALQNIMDDVDDARVYGGIHFRFDQVAGNRLGREIATFVYKHNLRPLNVLD